MQFHVDREEETVTKTSLETSCWLESNKVTCFNVETVKS